METPELENAASGAYTEGAGWEHILGGEDRIENGDRCECNRKAIVIGAYLLQTDAMRQGLLTFHVCAAWYGAVEQLDQQLGRGEFPSPIFLYYSYIPLPIFHESE